MNIHVVRVQILVIGSIALFTVESCGGWGGGVFLFTLQYNSARKRGNFRLKDKLALASTLNFNVIYANKK